MQFNPDPVLEKKNNASRTFICTQCGECCHIREKKNITEREESAYKNYLFKHYGIIYLADLSDITISIFPEEKEALEKESKKMSIKIDIKPKRAIYDKKSERLIILDYFINHDVCPFYNKKTKLCGVYAQRPLICRSYPLITAKNYGKCRYKKLDFNAYDEEKKYVKMLDDKIKMQKSVIIQMISEKSIEIPESITQELMESILKNSKIVELRTV
jgi:Fe-S-cluster containining protein